MSSVNGQEKLDHVKENGLRDSIREKILINGKSVKELIDLNQAGVDGDYDGKFDVHLIDGLESAATLRIHVKNGSPAADFLFDGSPLTVTVKTGFCGDGVQAYEDIVCEYEDNAWELPANRAEIGVASVSSTSNEQDNQAEFRIALDGLMSKFEVNHIARNNGGTIIDGNGGVGSERANALYDYAVMSGLRDALRENLFIGDKSIKTLVDENIANVSGDADGQLDVHLKNSGNASVIHVNIKNGNSTSVDLGENISVTLKAGNYGSAAKISEDIKYNYNAELKTWYKEVAKSEIKISGVSHKVNGADTEFTIAVDGLVNRERAVHMARESEATVIAVNGGGEAGDAVLKNLKATGLRDSVWNNIAINGKTVKERMNEAKAEGKAGNDSAVDVHVEVNTAAETSTVRIVIKSGFASEVALADNLTVTVKDGFTGGSVKATQDYTYTYFGGIWLAPGEKPLEFEAVRVSSISAPAFDGSADNNSEFWVYFDENITSTEYIYISMGADFLSSWSVTSGRYSASDLDKFNKYGVFNSLQNNIIITTPQGTYSIAEMMNIDPVHFPLPQQPNVVAIHCGQQNKYNAFCIVMGGDHAGVDGVEERPFSQSDFDFNYVMTFKAGLRLPSGLELKEDQSFVYDYVSKTWYVGSSASDIPAPLTVTLKDGEETIKTVSVISGNTVTLDDPEKEGYFFDGWYTDAECTQKYDFTNPVTESVTLYAKFTPMSKPADENTGNGGSGCGGTVSGVSMVASAVALLAACVFVALKRKNKTEE